MMIDELISFLLMIPIINDTSELRHSCQPSTKIEKECIDNTDIKIHIECLKTVSIVMGFKSAYNMRDTFNFIAVY